MSILVIGINHRTSPLSVLERVNLTDDEVPKAVEALAKRDNLREVVVVSTCNRTEVYAVTEKFHGAYADVRDFLCDLGRFSADDLHPHLYSEHDHGAVKHLYQVAAGLDSVVLGESEILGQIRTAWKVAQRAGGTRSRLDLLFRHALEVGKRVRSETGIARGTASVSHAAVEMAIEHHGSITGASVAVLGAGAMGEGIAVALHGAGVGEVTVINRSAARGEALAARVGGVALGFDRLRDVLASADVVLTGTGSTMPVITPDLVETINRPDRPLMIVDIAVPRDVAPEVASLANVTVFDIDDLSRWAQRGRRQREIEVAAVEALVGDEVERFLLDEAALQAGPLIGSLRSHAETIRGAELQRFAPQLDRLDPGQREFVDSLTKGIIAKLLHEPSTKLRNQAGTPQGQRNAAAVADLFDLG